MQAKIKLVRELRTGDSTVVGSTLHVELDLLTDATHVTYQTADNLAILPDNPLQDVELLAKTLVRHYSKLFQFSISRVLDRDMTLIKFLKSSR